MERSEAEAIYTAGREPVAEALLALSARLEAQDAQLAALAERVEELEQRLKRDWRNSSLPPSHDPPWLGKRGRSRGTGRTQGGQPGHVGHGRALFATEPVREVVDHWPGRCRCGHVFGADEREPAGEPARHQLAELPPLAVEISEHRLQRVCCPDCGRKVRAELPAGVPRGCFASAPTTASSRRGGKSAGRICAATSPSTPISEVVRRRYSAWTASRSRGNVFQAWKQFQQDGDRAALQRQVAAIKTQTRPLLEWGSSGRRQRHVRALAKNLLKLWPALWTFAGIPDVEPTNNAAERGLRAAVIYRKLSFGSRSQGGERTIERLLSVDQTCRLQRRSLYGYLGDALTARTRGDPIPTLA